MTALITVKIPFEAGMWVRGDIIRELRMGLDVMGLRYEIKDYGGFFVSSYLLTVTGTNEQIDTLWQGLRQVQTELKP